MQDEQGRIWPEGRYGDVDGSTIKHGGQCFGAWGLSYVRKTKKRRGKIIKVSYVTLYGYYRSLFDAYKCNELKNLKFNEKIPRSPSSVFKYRRPFVFKDFLGIN